jgi:hypothetical protein
MAKSAFQIIAEVHHEMGQPGLLHCIQVLGDTYDDLDNEVAQAYEEFYGELMDFVKQQTVDQ